MTPMALWQKIVYVLGEALLVAGLLWGLYRAFVVRACPVGPFNDLTLIVIGLGVAVLPLHPFGRREEGIEAPGSGAVTGAATAGGTEAAATQAAGKMPAPPNGTPALRESPAGTRALPGYLAPALRHHPALAIAVWVLAILGVAYSLWARLTVQPGIWWFVGLVPAALYFWFGISTSKDGGQRRPPSKTRPPAPPAEQEKKRAGSPRSGGGRDA